MPEPQNNYLGSDMDDLADFEAQEKIAGGQLSNQIRSGKIDFSAELPEVPERAGFDLDDDSAQFMPGLNNALR